MNSRSVADKHALALSSATASCRTTVMEFVSPGRQKAAGLALDSLLEASRVEHAYTAATPTAMEGELLSDISEALAAEESANQSGSGSPLENAQTVAQALKRFSAPRV
jgi:hypothetical protein